MQPYSTRDGLIQSTDWMAVSVIIDDELPKEAPPDHFWKVFEGGTPVWQHRAILYNKYGESVLTFLAKPKSTSVINPRAGLVEVSNEWLYHGIGVSGALDLLRWVCPYQITGLSRLDLCMDFQPTLAQVDIIKGLSEKRYYIAGKRNRSEFVSSPTDAYVPEIWRGFCPHQQSWGHKSSAVKWKLYYKSKELRDNGGGWFSKPYIVDGWHHYGLDEDNVWRLEVSMHDCNSLLLDGRPIDYKRWAADEVNIFCSMYADRFKVRRNEGHKDRTNDKELPFLPISTSHHCRCKRYEGENVHSARIGLLRSLVKYAAMEEVYLDAAASRQVSEHVEALVNHDGLERYFEGMVGKTLGQWTKEMVELREGKVLRANTLPKNTDIRECADFDEQPPSRWSIIQN